MRSDGANEDGLACLGVDEAPCEDVAGTMDSSDFVRDGDVAARALGDQAVLFTSSAVFEEDDDGLVVVDLQRQAFLQRTSIAGEVIAQVVRIGSIELIDYIVVGSDDEFIPALIIAARDAELITERSDVVADCL